MIYSDKMMKLLKISVFICLAALLPAGVIKAQGGFGSSEKEKSVSKARNLSLINTVFPVVVGAATANLFENATAKTAGSALVVYGLLMGPSNGNFYAGDYARGMTGALARAGAGYLMLDATRELTGPDIAEGLGWDDKAVSLTDTKILVGGAVFLGSIAYNIITAKTSVEDYNSGMGYTLNISGEQFGRRNYLALKASISL